MQQDAVVTFEPIAPTFTLKTWHMIVAVFLFACVMYFVVWRARRRSDNEGSLRLRE